MLEKKPNENNVLVLDTNVNIATALNNNNKSEINENKENTSTRTMKIFANLVSAETIKGDVQKANDKNNNKVDDVKRTDEDQT